MSTECDLGELKTYTISNLSVLKMSIRSAIKQGKELDGTFNFEKFKSSLKEKLAKVYDLTNPDLLQGDLNNLIKTNNYAQLQGHYEELSKLFVTTGENQIAPEEEESALNIEDQLKGETVRTPFSDIDKEIYRESLGINLFRVNNFNKDIIKTILLDGINLISSNKKLNINISKYKESQYANILNFIKAEFKDDSFPDSIYDQNGDYIFDSVSTLDSFKSYLDDMTDSVFLSKIDVENRMLQNNEEGDISFLKALNSYVNLVYFNDQMQSSLGKMIEVQFPNQEGFNNEFNRYTLLNGNQLNKNWSDEEVVDAFKNIGKLSALLIPTIPYTDRNGKTKHSTITPVIYTKAFQNLLTACMNRGGALGVNAFLVHKDPKFYIGKILEDIYKKKNTVIKSLDYQDQDVLFSVYNHIFKPGALLDQEKESPIKSSKYPISSCYFGIIDRIVEMNYQMVKYRSFDKSYDLGIRPKFYNSKVAYDTAQDLNLKSQGDLDSKVTQTKGGMTLHIDDNLDIEFTGELLSNKNNKIEVKYLKDGVDITNQIEKYFKTLITQKNGKFEIQNQDCLKIYNYISNILGLNDTNLLKTYTMQELKSSNALSYIKGMVVTTGKMITANYIYQDFYGKIEYSAAKRTVKKGTEDAKIYDIAKFVETNSKIYGFNDISRKIQQGQTILTPVVADSTVWLENYASALIVIGEGQAKSTTNDAFGHKQANYRMSSLGSIPWFYFQQSKEEKEEGQLLGQLLADKEYLNEVSSTKDITSQALENLKRRVEVELPNKIAEVRRNASKHLLTSKFPEAIKQVNVSQDVELKKGITKKIKDMQFSELIYNSIIFNFYGKYFTGEGYNIQPVTYSDKTTFYNYLIDSEVRLDGRVSLSNMTTRDKIQTMIDTIGQMYKNVATNVIEDYESIFANDANFPIRPIEGITEQYINDIDKYLRANVSEASLIRKAIGKEIQLDVMYQKNGNTIKLNPVLMYNGFKLYQDYDLLAAKYKVEEDRFIKTLEKKNVIFYTNIKGQNTEVYDMFYKYMHMSDMGSQDSNKTDEIIKSWIDGDHLLISKNGKLNPFFKNYFYTESLLSNNLRIGLMGTEVADPLKMKTGDNILETYNPEIMERAEANLQNTSYKRANIITATLSTVLQQEDNGVPEDINVAVIRDLPASVWNFTGLSDKPVDSMDGAAFVLATQSIQENGALQDYGVGDDKKSIWHGFHKDTCSACLLKFATFVLSNERMRYSITSDVSLYEMFKKMTNQQWGDEVYLGNKLLSKPVFYERYHKFYQIVGFGKNSTGYFTKEIQVDINGNPSGEKPIDCYHIYDANSNHYIVDEDSAKTSIEKEGFHPINSVFELHAALGGIYSYELINGTLKPSESSNFALNDYMNEIKVDGKQILKTYVISYLANNSAVKRGVRNINQTSSWTDQTPLTSMKLKSYGLGVQMDPDHEKDDAEITQFSQVITALEAGGRLHESAAEVYRSLGTVAKLFCNTELQALLDGNIKEEDVSKLYEILGKSLIENYTKQSDAELGQTIVNRVSKEFNLNIDHKSDLWKMPFSDSAIYGSVMQVYSSLINKNAIKGKYPGLGAILVPGYGYMQLFKLNGEYYFAEDIYSIAYKAMLDPDKGFYEYLKSKGDVPDDNHEYHKYLVKSYLDYIQDPDIEQELGRGDKFQNEHEFYKINNESFRPSDTVFMKLTFNNGQTTSVNIALDTIEKYYEFKDSVTPEQAYDFLIKYNHITPIFDDQNNALTIVGVKYANSVSKSRDLSPANLSWKYMIGDEIHEANIFDVDAVKNHKTSEEIQKAFDDIKLKSTFVINGKTYEIIPGTLINEEAQAVMSNMYANTFGTETQTLGQATSYYKRLANGNIKAKKLNINNGNYYDMVFVNGKNRHVYVSFNAVKSDPTSQFYPKEQEFKYTRRILEDGIVNIYVTTKEGQKLFKIGYVEKNADDSAKVVQFIHKYTVLTKGAKNRVEASTIYQIDPNTSELSNLVHNLYYANSYKNIQINNLSTNKELMKKLIPILDMDTTLQDHLNFVNNEILSKNIWDTYDDILSNYYDTFNKELSSSFFKSLYFTAARTPAQALQSFMKMKIIGFAKTSKNRVYVSHFQTYLQGSDYDIDKSYMMGFSFDDNGKYIGWSPLFNYDSLETLQASEYLPFPTGNTVESGIHDVSNYTKAIQEAISDSDRIKKFADLLTYINSTGITAINASDDIIQAINKHQAYLYKMSPLIITKALKNSISAKVQNIVQDARNMYEAYQPVSAQELHDAVDGKQTDILVALNPITKFLMQEENMIGKNVISVAANGEKVFYTTSFYFNDQLRHHPENANNIKFSSTFNRIQGRATGSISSVTKNIIGNVSLENINDYYKQFQEQYIISSTTVTKVDQVISQLLTAATDNAKELLLAKMNAGMNLAGMYVHMMVLGFNVQDIIAYMTSPAVSAIEFMSKANIFDPNIQKSDVKTVIRDLFGTANTHNGKTTYSGLSSLQNNLIKNTNTGGYMIQLATKILKPFVLVNGKVDSKAVNEIIEDLMEFKTIQNKAAETTILAQVFLKVNQGLPSSSEGILNSLNKIKTAITDREDTIDLSDDDAVNQVMQNNPELDQEEVMKSITKFKKLNMINNIDMDMWTRNDKVTYTTGTDTQFSENYKDLVIQYYNLIKGTWNVFDIIEKVPQYKIIYDIFRSMCVMQERFITRDRLTKHVSSKLKYLNEDKLKRISSYIDNLLILQWLGGQNMTLPLNKGDIKYDEYARQVTVSENQAIPLNSLEGLATFKHYMETVLIPRYQKNPNFQENEFIQDFKNGYDQYTFKKLDMDMLRVKDSTFNSIKFSNYLRGFKELRNEKIGDLKLTDAFMLYNIVVNKNKYGSERMTSLFQFYLDQNVNEENILTKYYQSVGDLDYDNTQSIDELLKSIGYNESDMQSSIARVVNDVDFQKDDYVKTLVDGELVLMKRVGKGYRQVSTVVPFVENEDFGKKMLRSKNYLNDFTFGTSQLQANKALVTSLDSENDKRAEAALINLTQSGKIKINRICS